jgi:succinate-acetate transporter protein
LYNVQARGITTPNVVVGMAVFCGGLAQLLAGMWEFPKGNAFGATGESRLTDRLSPSFFHSWQF